MCCRKNQLRVGLADHILIGKHTCVQLQGFGRPRNTHVCPRTNTLRVESRNTRVWRRPVAAVSIHMCVAEEVNSGLNKDQGLQGRGRPGAAASTHMCVSEKTAFIQGCTQGSNVVWDWPTDCCCEHTHVCVAESHVNSRLAPRIKKVQEFGRPNFAATRCCCEHTHVIFRKNPIHSRLHPRIKGGIGSADELLP